MKASSVRRRSKAQIIEDKIKEAERLKSVEKKLEDWQQLESQLAEANTKIREAEVVHEHGQMMFNSGLLKHKDDGTYDVVTDPVEREQLRQEYENHSKSKHQSQLDD